MIVFQMVYLFDVVLIYYTPEYASTNFLSWKEYIPKRGIWVYLAIKFGYD